MIIVKQVTFYAKKRVKYKNNIQLRKKMSTLLHFQRQMTFLVLFWQSSAVCVCNRLMFFFLVLSVCWLSRGGSPSVLQLKLKGLKDKTLLPLVFPLCLLLFSGQPSLANLLQGLTGVHDEGQSHPGCAIAALPGEAQEGGPEEGAASHEGCPHVQWHQDKVQKL